MGWVGRAATGVATGGASELGNPYVSQAQSAVGGGGGKNGGGKGSTPPTAPDFNAAAQNQAQSGRPDQTNAYGSSVNWTTGPDGRPVENQSFGGPMGQAASGLQGQIADAWGKPLDNGQQARDAATNAVYGQETSRLNPQWDQQMQQFQSQMAAQGLAPGSEAYNNAYGNVSRARNDSYSTAQNQAITMGGQEGQRAQQMDLTSRFAPEQALAGFNQFTGQPGTGQGAQYLPAAMAQYGGALQGYGIQQQGKNSQMSGLANLGMDAAMLAKYAPAAAAAGG